MAKAMPKRRAEAATGQTVECPYCRKDTPVVAAEDYRPVYADCSVCGKRFIAQRLRAGLDAMKLEDAPLLLDPDRRESEMGQGDEE